MSMTFLKHLRGVKDPTVQNLYYRFNLADRLGNDPRYWYCCELMYRSIDWEATHPPVS